MQKCSFFNSINGDRKYKAEAWAEQIASIIGNGILANPADNLRVEAKESMTVLVKPGRAWINGYFYWNTEAYLLQLSVGDGSLNRIDRVVLRWSLSTRDIFLAIKKGTAASNPTAPAIQRDADIYELVLADITVSKGAVSIVKANIADTRYLLDICGKVAPLFDDLDLSDFYEECSRNMSQQILAWENQTEDQEARFIAGMNDFTSRVQNMEQDYSQWKAMVDGWRSITVTELARAVSFHLDNQFALEGTTKTTTETESGAVTVLKWVASGKALAEQTTIELPDESIETTQKVYNTDDSVFRHVKMTVTVNGNVITSKVVSV